MCIPLTLLVCVVKLFKALDMHTCKCILDVLFVMCVHLFFREFENELRIERESRADVDEHNSQLRSHVADLLNQKGSA